MVNVTLAPACPLGTDVAEMHEGPTADESDLWPAIRSGGENSDGASSRWFYEERLGES